MASTDWQEIYRSYSADELAAEITALKAQATHYSQQSIGNKSYSKDLAEVRNRLQAATRVTNERANAHKPASSSVGIVNFSCFRA